MTSDREAKIIDAISNAEDIKAPVADGQPGQKPRLLIENCDPDRTVVALRISSLMLAGFMTGACLSVSLSTRFREGPLPR